MYHGLYAFALLFIKLFCHIPAGIRCELITIQITTEYAGNVISIARFKGGCSDLKRIVRELFNATREH